MIELITLGILIVFIIITVVMYYTFNSRVESLECQSKWYEEKLKDYQESLSDMKVETYSMADALNLRWQGEQKGKWIKS